MKPIHDSSKNHDTSELRKILPFETFKIAFEKFLEQADLNAESGVSNGKKSLYGLPKPEKGTSTSGKLKVDGGDLGQQFGQGKKSSAPYVNWHFVSIYYIPATQKIILGIETAKKYAHLQELGTYERVAIEGKDTKIAAFYQCFRSKMDCNELYKEFIDISERVMELGLE